MKRHGFTIAETAVAVVILGVILGVGLQVMSAAAKAEARLHRRQLAIQEVQNQLERLELVGWDDLNDDVGKSLALSEAAQGQLREARIVVSVHESEKSETLPEAKQIVVTLTWQEPEEDSPSRVRLTTWRFFELNTEN